MPYSAGEKDMLKVGLFVRLEAKPGKEEEVAAFLKQGLQLANQEAITPLWFALRLGTDTFAKTVKMFRLFFNNRSKLFHGDPGLKPEIVEGRYFRGF